MPTTVTLPTLPTDWKSTAVGIIGAIFTLLQPYLSTGKITLEQIAIAIIIAVGFWFIPAKVDPVDEKKIVDTVVGLVGAVSPPALAAPITISPLEQQIIDAVRGTVANLATPDGAVTTPPAV